MGFVGNAALMGTDLRKEEHLPIGRPPQSDLVPGDERYHPVVIRLLSLELGDADPDLWTPDERESFVTAFWTKYREPMMMLGFVSSPPPRVKLKRGLKS